MWGGVWHSHSTLPFARYAVAQWPSGACTPPAECRTAAFWLHQQWRQWAYAAQDSLSKQPTCMDTSLWSLDHLLQPTSHACASCGKRDPIVTADHWIGGSSRACTSWGLSWLCCFWASWSIFCVSSISNLQASTTSSDETVPLDPSAFRRSLNVPVSFTIAFPSNLHCKSSLFCMMMCSTATRCARYPLVLPWWELMDMLKTDPPGSLIFRLCGSSLVVTRSVGGTYGTGGQLLSCPFLHSESFNRSGALRVVLILACCQSVVLSMSLLKEDFGGTRRNHTACVVAWKKLRRKQNFRSPKILLVPIACMTGWMAWFRKKISLRKMHCLKCTGFLIQSVLSILLSRQTETKEWYFLCN